MGNDWDNLYVEVTNIYNKAMEHLVDCPTTEGNLGYMQVALSACELKAKVIASKEDNECCTQQQ